MVRRQGTGHAHQRAADHIGLQAQRVDVLADRVRGLLVVADRTQRAPPGAVVETVAEPPAGAYHRPHDQHEDPARRLTGDRLLERPRDIGDAQAAVGQPLLVDDRQAQDLGDADRGHRQVVALEPHADPRHRPAGAAGHQRGRQQAERDRQREAPDVTARGRGGQQRGGVGADGKKACHAGVEQSAVTPLHVQRQAQQRIDAAGDQEADQVLAQAVQIHHNNLPRISPCGRNSRISTMITNASALL